MTAAAGGHGGPFGPGGPPGGPPGAGPFAPDPSGYGAPPGYGGYGAPPGPGAGAPPTGSGAMRDRPDLRRKLQLLERAAVWVVVVVLVGAALTAVMLAVTTGDDPEPFRGHTGPAMLMAALAVGTTLLTLLYSLRKRSLQERVGQGGGTMMMWLWLHVALGLIALVSAVLHAGWSALSPRLTSGWVLFAIFVGLVGSGVVWRLVYRLVPPRAAPKIGNYSAAGSVGRAELQFGEIEKLSAGRSADFQRIKDWVLGAEPAPEAFAQAVATLPDPAERAAIGEVLALAQSRRRALGRAVLQGKYNRSLSRWRSLHVPLTLMLVPALLIHVVGATYLPSKVLPVGAAPTEGMSGFAKASDCKGCHATIYQQWTTSMHAHALTSPVTVVQNNQLVRLELSKKASPDPQQICVNCHAPLAAAVTGDSLLPFSAVGYDDDALNEGVTCVVCHQFNGGSAPGSAGLSKYRDDLEPGSVMYGALKDPVGNSFHQSASNAIAKAPQQMCRNCHNVHYDRNGDGRIEKATDLVLQSTDEEHQEYVAEGGQGTCLTCHMPVRQKARAAEEAIIPLEQDREAPSRVVHDHTFVGVDYPLDEVKKRDPHRADREKLLRGGAKMEIDPVGVAAVGGTVSFKVNITNVGAGHNLPTGFAFARQMWLEVTVTDPSGAVVGSSGRLASSDSDLCDAATMDDAGSNVARFIKGCDASDPQLVNIQAKLVERTEPLRDKNGQLARNDKNELITSQPEGAEETFLQRLDGGVVLRERPFDKQKMATIPPNDTRSYAYRLPVRGRPAALTVRLLFRNLPPYFLRALAAGQPKDEEPQLGPLVPNLQVVEMAVVKQQLFAR